MRLTSANLMRQTDEKAVRDYGVPSTLLMTNAARALAEAAYSLLRENRSAVVFCGSGNNGGDGIAAAVHLLSRGVDVRCYLVGERDKMSSDEKEMERRLLEAGGALTDFFPENEKIKAFTDGAGVLIDAIFGIGLTRAVTGKALAAIRLINASPAPVVSADLASGVEADTGRILGEAVHADVTVTFSMAKIGHFAEPGCTCRGELKVAPIGIPKELLKGAETNVFAVGPGDVTLPKRQEISHKGDYGKLLILGGSVGYTGAPALCAQAASRGGAGLVSLGVPAAIYPIEASRLYSPMPFPLACDESGKLTTDAQLEIVDRIAASDVCVLGCGLGRSEELSKLVRSVYRMSTKQLVVDADGLFALGNEETTLRMAHMPPIFTPHAGEFLRLGGTLTGDRVTDARNFATSRQCILVLKGHRTVCAFPDGEVYIIDAGNAGMAKGGSGDVLAGLIGAMCCQLPLKRAVVTACWVHAHAGDLCAERFGEYAMLPTDILDAIPETMKTITADRYEG
ncbi:MAG: NAD(P)H-hydrate dehydratase [Oscillospiraceae bacterium]